MGDEGMVAVLVLVAVSVVTILIVGWIQGRKRREAWRTLALRLGCSFSARDPFKISHACPQPLFKNGHSRRARNMLCGEVQGRGLKCFDYQYSRGHGKNRRTYYFTALVLEPPIWFRPLTIRPESLFDRVGEFFGLDDIDFESEEFSRRFFVKCRNPRFAYDVLHARTMALLLQCGNIYVEADGRSILFYYSGRSLVPEEVEAMIRRGLEFIELIPDYLIEQDRKEA